ncbi:hypothetical protein VTK56DRAFT_8744 [Thermocarpiscus australiensis]
MTRDKAHTISLTLADVLGHAQDVRIHRHKGCKVVVVVVEIAVVVAANQKEKNNENPLFWPPLLRSVSQWAVPGPFLCYLWHFVALRAGYLPEFQNMPPGYSDSRNSPPKATRPRVPTTNPARRTQNPSSNSPTETDVCRSNHAPCPKTHPMQKRESRLTPEQHHMTFHMQNSRR